MVKDQKFAPICIWCNEPWSDANIRVEEVYASDGCDTCGFGTVVSGTVSISYHSCGKEMYRKEFEDRPNG